MKVSFIIPTLNRGRYVVRAVNSCLSLQHANDIEIEVIVLDSMSDDGSWESLNNSFGTNSQVILAQNSRGLGPTKSWLDGARLATGQFVTFLWSDDYISPSFLMTLLPPLREGCDIAIGDGIVRDIDDDSPLPAEEPQLVFVSGETLLYRYLGLIDGRALPVSPAAALFTRAVFDNWVSAVESWCREPGIRNEIMWRRAIGPDLMLFLTTGMHGDGRAVLANNIVTQFSSHSESITTSSSSWPLRCGYWLAKWWIIEAAIEQKKQYAIAPLVRLVVQGQILTIVSCFGSVKGNTDEAMVLLYKVESRRAYSLLIDTLGSLQGGMAMLGSSLRLLYRMAARFMS